MSDLPVPRFDTFYRHAELTRLLHDYAQARPDLVRVDSLGQSHEGRDIWVVVLTQSATGIDTDKPAFWCDGNIHAGELTASTACLYWLHHLLLGYGDGDAQARQLLYRLGEDPYRDRLMLAWARAGGIGNGAARWHDLATLPQRWSALKFPLRAADFISRGIAEGPALGHVLTLAEDAWLAADFPLDASALAALADQTAARFTRDHRL